MVVRVPEAKGQALITHWIDRRIAYDGSQLSAHWILAETGLAGDALVAFRGPCRVERAEIADLADLDGPGIAADDMLHFMWECFASTDLLLAVHRQRLLSATAGELLNELAVAAEVRRAGDDLFVDDGKLSISIATASPVSTLIHFALNISPGGAPVRIATLQQLGVDPVRFASRLLSQVAAEQSTIAIARSKVRAKGEWQR